MAKNRKRKEIEKRSKIGRAAARLFNKKGYLETNMEHIAASAKVSKGNLYYYFCTKEDILFFILSNYMDLALENLEADLQKIENGFSKLRFFISRHVELYVNNVDEAKTLLHEKRSLSTKHYRDIAEKERTYYGIVSRLLRDLCNGPDRPSSDEVTVMTFLLFGMCNWIYSWYDIKGSVTPDKLSQLIWEIYTDGFKGMMD
jgi:AcrR family transcriptional regulator